MESPNLDHGGSKMSQIMTMDHGYGPWSKSCRSDHDHGPNHGFFGPWSHEFTTVKSRLNIGNKPYLTTYQGGPSPQYENFAVLLKFWLSSRII